MEIEAKFRVDDAHAFATVLALDTLGAYTLQASAESEQQRNTYYDTPDKRLQAARYGLRIREIAGRCTATLKGPGEVRNGVHQRGEWEVETASSNPSDWPPGELREQVLQLIGDAPLEPTLTILTRRHHIIASRNQVTIAEVSLDEGAFVVGPHSRPFRELEIELLPDGSPADLEELQAALQQHIVLTPENRSKLEQGLALREEVTPDDA